MRASCVSIILASLFSLWLHHPCPAALPDTPLTVRLEYARSEQARPLLVAVLTPHTEYYTYAHHGDSLLPTRVGLIAASRPLTDADAAVRYPPGVVRRDALSGKDVAAYTGPAPVFLTLPPADLERSESRHHLTNAATLSLRVSLLLCSAAHCIPVDEIFPLPPLPDADALPFILDTPWITAWNDSVPGVLLTDPPADASLSLSLPALPLVAVPGTSDLERSESRRHATAAPAPGWDFKPIQANASIEPTGLATALFWGLLAGLILNVMPCVLPVLTLKMLTLLGPAGADGDDPDRLRRFREHNLLFAAGVLTWFALLAGAISLLDLTWGGLFQYAGALSVLAGLTGLLALSMLDLCTLPIIDLKLGPATPTSPRGQAYLAGLTATLLATPCSGPLLGGVLAWSASRPPLVVLAVLLGTGCGMSLPYLLFAARPSAVNLLPRPGPWLAWLERGVGLFLLATTLWLLTILPRATALILASGLIVLLLVLILRRSRRMGRSPLPSLAVALLCGLPCLWILNGPHEAPEQNRAVWEPFTPESFAQALGQDRVLLEFTADWCPNCKALELTTLSPEHVRDWKKRYNLR
ncbi:MAG: hypothetical protein LBC10_05715, partial [Deltaproteobacteria bacterium]|nr:hypothetical protein [Deltaproteobacteria bacterium]